MVDLVSETGHHNEKKGESKQATAKSEIGACRFDLCSDKVSSIQEDVVTAKQATAKSEIGACRLDLCSDKSSSVKEDVVTLATPSKAPPTIDADLGKRIFVDLNADETEPSAQRFEEFVVSMGGTVLALSNFGETGGEVSQLMRIKSLLREGRIM